MRPVISDPEKNREFLSQGYLHEQLLSEEEVEHLYELIKRTCRQSLGPASPDDVNSGPLFSTYTQPDIDLRRTVDAEVRRIMQQHIVGLLHNYKILSCGVFIKPPGGDVFRLHHHWTVLDDYRKYAVNIWCPLQRTSVENGTLHVLPNTHKIFPEIVTFAYEACYADYEHKLRTKYSVPLESAPGQAAIFDLTLHHWSTPNTTDEPRIAIHCNCIPAEDEPVLMYFDKEHPERFEMYQANEEFYVGDLHIPFGKEMERPTNLPFLGYVSNSNVNLSYEEYDSTIRNAASVREKLYADY